MTLIYIRVYLAFDNIFWYLTMILHDSYLRTFCGCWVDEMIILDSHKTMINNCHYVSTKLLCNSKLMWHLGFDVQIVQWFDLALQLSRDRIVLEVQLG